MPEEVVHVGLRFEERGGPPAGDHHVPAASRRLEGKASPHPRSAAGDHDHLPREGGVRVPDVPVGVGSRRHAPDHVAGAGGIPLRLQRREKAEQRVGRRMPRVRFRHLLPRRLRERLEETIRLEGPLDGGRELPLDRELLVREGGVSQEAACEESGNPLVEGPLGHPGKEPEDEPLLEHPVDPVVPVDELPGGALELPDDVDGAAHGTSRYGFPDPGTAPRGGSGERQGKGKQAGEIACPRVRPTLHGHLAGGDGHPFERGVCSKGVRPDGHGDRVRRLRAVSRRSFRREDQGSEEMERPLRVSLTERRPAGGDLPRGDLSPYSFADLRDQFPVPDSHLPRPGKDRPHLPVVTPEEVRKFLFPEIFRLVRVHQDPVEIGEVEIAPRPFGDVPVQVAQILRRFPEGSRCTPTRRGPRSCAGSRTPTRGSGG